MSTGVIGVNYFVRFFIIINIFHDVFLLEGLMLSLGKGMYKMNLEHVTTSRERKHIKIS